MVRRGEQGARRKRRHSSPTRVEDHLPCAKRRKAHSTPYPPEVWDSLSKITLTRKALEEFDRRITAEIVTTEETSKRGACGTPRRLLRSDTRRLKAYADSGGPHLGRLRGYADRPHRWCTMSKRSRESGLPGNSDTRKTRTSGPYDPQFEQILIDNGIYPDEYTVSSGEVPEPDNLDEIRHRLGQDRRSLSPSRFDDATFKKFRWDNRYAKSEQDVRSNVIPAITGSERHHTRSSEHGFSALELFASSLKAPKPDVYYGARPEEIDTRVRNDLGPYIVPTSDTSRPVAPNCFFEIKGGSGGAEVLRRQATYAGAVGARGMFHLQNYGKATPIYDNNAYSLVSTYHAGTGTLQMYVTHPRESVAGGTEYHLTQLRSYGMTGDIHDFRRGAATFRNATDMSKEQRDQFIAAANITARNLPAIAPRSSETASRTSISAVNDGGSIGSETSIDELAPEYEQRPKRWRPVSPRSPSSSGARG